MRADRLHVRARVRLGHRIRRVQLPGRHARQVALALLLGAVVLIIQAEMKWVLSPPESDIQPRESSTWISA